MRITSSFSLLLAAAALAGCSADGGLDGNGGSRGDNPTAPAIGKYDMANGCYALQSTSLNAFAVLDGGGYAMTGAGVAGAEPFFMKPASLGRYLFHSSDQRLMAASGGVVPVDAPADSAIWTIEEAGTGAFTISSNAGEALGIDAGGALVLGGAAETFRFEPAGGCSEFPEMPLGIDGQTYTGTGVDKPVIGFADVHSHMGMSSEMSADDSVGPSAGGVLYGTVFHRLGVSQALDNCEAYHGPDGIRDANNVIQATPTSTHDTQGWPTFIDWPARDQLTHQAMYYRWVERAYDAGLRLLVNHGTNIAALCRLGQNYSLQPDTDCDDMSVAEKQVHYIYDIQDYIDAQEGGPGKGWFRIVKSPEQARQVINDGKLAVVLGIEVAQVFDCGVTILADGTEQRNCDEAQIDQKIDELYELGVRQLFPYHDIDSSLGGTGIFSGDVINFLNFMDTGQFWKTYDCPAGGDQDYLYNAGAIMTTAAPGTGNDPISEAFISTAQGSAPVYKPDVRQCNARGMTDLGRHAIEKLMERKLIIDIDHAELSIKQDMLDIAEQQTPPYPMISAHGGHGGISNDQAREILANGGLIYPYKPNGRGQANFVQTIKNLRAPNNPYLFAVGYGADANGFGGFAGPRGADAQPVEYPFTLFRGPGWGPQFAAAGIQPLTVDLLTIPDSGKFWNTDEVGMAHYGLVADWVEEVRLEGGEDAITALYNSAEAYIQMWERIVNRGN